MSYSINVVVYKKLARKTDDCRRMARTPLCALSQEIVSTAAHSPCQIFRAWRQGQWRIFVFLAVFSVD